jgi:hypothetical protein
MRSSPGIAITKPPFSCRISALPIYLLMVVTLAACATSRFIAGDQKNSLPLAERRLIEEVHSVAVAPFYHDDYHWRQLAQETLSAPKLEVVSERKVDAAARGTGKDLSGIGPDARGDVLVKLGRSLQTDAVLNGVVLSNGDRHELIIQLISSDDSRILFWQAADFKSKDKLMDPDAQRKLISRMLAPLVANVAKRRKPPAAQPVHLKTLEAPTAAPRRQADQGPKPENQPKAEKRQKAGKRHEREQRPAAAPEDISPM